MVPQIPQKNSHQWVVMQELVKNANDPFLRHCYVLGIDGLTHLQMVKAISKLRDRGWPIEDTGINENKYTDKHGYRLDKDRYHLFKAALAISLAKLN